MAVQSLLRSPLVKKGVALVAVVGLLVSILRRGRRKATRTAEGRGKVDAVFLRRIGALARVVVPNWHCQEVMDLCLLTVFLVLRTYMSIYLAGVNGKIVGAIVQKDLGLFVVRVLKLGVLAVPASFVNSFLEFLIRRLALNFKKRLTQHFFAQYFKDLVFYQLEGLDSRVSNPEQRLTADISQWAHSLSQIYPNFSKPTLDIFLFSRKLGTSVGWYGPLAIIGWYLFSGVLLRLFSPSFGALVAEGQQLEGRYRASHSSIVRHSEEIAFYQGNHWEKSRLKILFDHMLSHGSLMMRKRLFMGTFDALLVKYGAVLFGYAVLGLPVFGPGSEEYLKSRGDSPSALTDDYIRNSSLLINLAKAIGRLVISYKEIQRLAGLTTLVAEMEEVLSELASGKFVAQSAEDSPSEAERSKRLPEKGSSQDRPSRLREGGSAQEPEASGERRERPTSPGPVSPSKRLGRSAMRESRGTLVVTEDVIRFEDVPVVSPGGDVILRAISFEVRAGVNTIVTGPNGCGKSSLFRILSGLWPLSGGVLYRPEISKLFYVPQKPYLPSGSLRDQMIYPHSHDQFRRGGRADDELVQMLREVNLQNILERNGGLDSVKEWKDELSGGEKQRLAMVRLFYHRPMFGVLDECTSAVSVEIEEFLYRKAKRLGMTLLTISQRSTLFPYHDMVITLDGEGGYRLTSNRP